MVSTGSKSYVICLQKAELESKPVVEGLSYVLEKVCVYLSFLSCTRKLCSNKLFSLRVLFKTVCKWPSLEVENNMQWKLEIKHTKNMRWNSPSEIPCVQKEASYMIIANMTNFQVVCGVMKDWWSWSATNSKVYTLCIFWLKISLSIKWFQHLARKCKYLFRWRKNIFVSIANTPSCS